MLKRGIVNRRNSDRAQVVLLAVRIKESNCGLEWRLSTYETPVCWTNIRPISSQPFPPFLRPPYRHPRNRPFIHRGRRFSMPLPRDRKQNGLGQGGGKKKLGRWKSIRGVGKGFIRNNLKGESSDILDSYINKVYKRNVTRWKLFEYICNDSRKWKKNFVEL